MAATNMIETDVAPASGAKKQIRGGLLDPALLWKALPDALRKLDPRTLWRNPVMLIVEVGAVWSTILAILGAAESASSNSGPTAVVSVNEPCDVTARPFIDTYLGVRVDCAKAGGDFAMGQIVPIRGLAPADPAVPADAVTASGSGLDPNISPGYAALQVGRVAKARGVSPEAIRELVADHTDGRSLGFLGEPRVNLVELNIELDSKYPMKS